MKYREEIDGLRAIAVLSVIIFHTGFSFLLGGYIGVDVFFVISGYLITRLIYDELNFNTFTFIGFYRRRAARLFPSLCITLLFTLLFGIFFYNNQKLDVLGKEIFYSSLGAANILFAQGIDYFTDDTDVIALIHLWSLGVEEQFYLVWPVTLILLASFRLYTALFVVFFLLILSLVLSIYSIEADAIGAYYYPQYRAFELLVGAFTAIIMHGSFLDKFHFLNKLKEFLSLLGMVLIIVPMFLLNENSTFPGINAIWPCIGTALLIIFGSGSLMARVLSCKTLVSIGLISYPLYLYHQPLISFLYFFELKPPKIIIFVFVLLVAGPLAWLTYKYIEIPIRKSAHKERNRPSRITLRTMAISLIGFAFLGLLIAKSGGFPSRFLLLNPFAYKITQNSLSTFHTTYDQGFIVSEAPHGRVLFIGDSVIQQYVSPISKVLELEKSELDIVTRSNCVLLKNIEFRDHKRDISCDELRNRLYANKKSYDYIIISQSWESYNADILNAPPISEEKYTMRKWASFIDKTIEHFKPFAKKIIIIGAHLNVGGTSELRATMSISREIYNMRLINLKVLNYDLLEDYSLFFEQWASDTNVTIINPKDIWCEHECVLHNGSWSFYYDSLHITNISTEFIVQNLKRMKRL